MGWTHTSNWLLLRLNEPTYVTILHQRQAGVPWPSAEDPTRSASVANMNPSFTLYEGYDGDDGDHHTYNNRGDIVWAEDLAYLDHLENNSKSFVELTWYLEAGDYTVALGSNADSNDTDRQGYKTVITTSTIEPALVQCGVPSASHHFEEAAAAIHEYLHDNYEGTHPDLGSDAHDLEKVATIFYGSIHEEEQILGQVNEGWFEFVRTYLRSSAWIRFDLRLRRHVFEAWMTGFEMYLQVGCDETRKLPRNLLTCEVVDLSHDFDEITAEIHDHIHDLYGAWNPALAEEAHALDEITAFMHELYHDIGALIPELGETWHLFVEAIEESGLIDTDPNLKELFESTEQAFAELNSLLGDCGPSDGPGNS